MDDYLETRVVNDDDRVDKLFRDLNLLAETNARAGAMCVGVIAFTRPPVNDAELVLRFRSLFAALVPLLPLEDFEDEKARRSQVCAQMLKAIIQELIGHIGPTHKALTFVLSKSLLQELDAVKEKTVLM